jgi:2-polyprenyl-3-methyl-5-hydroxy-6-metoxy-1,4-benzoquinol methylase
MSDIGDEAAAFDHRVEERVREGWIPDLQRAVPVDWFYNNVWRRPELAEMVLGEYLRFAREHLPPPPARLVELACGTGYMSLELARDGYDVTGVDVSQRSLDVAQETADSSARTVRYGSLKYVVADATKWEPETRVDAVCMFLSLHHFADPEIFLDHVGSMLVPGGHVVIIEPARDWLTPWNAAVASLIRLMLGAFGGWHQEVEFPNNEGELAHVVSETLREYTEATDPQEHRQSPADNSSRADRMLAALRARFEVTTVSTGFGIVPRLVGGIRGQDANHTLEIANFVRLFDEYCVRRGLIQPGVFYFAGTAR